MLRESLVNSSLSEADFQIQSYILNLSQSFSLLSNIYDE